MGPIWLNKWRHTLYFSQPCGRKKWWICWFYGFENYPRITSGNFKIDPFPTPEPVDPELKDFGPTDPEAINL